MPEVETHVAVDLVGDSALRKEVVQCWLDVSNAGGAVGFPFLPVVIDQVSAAADRLAQEVAAGSVLVFVATIDGELVGWVSLRLNRHKLTRHWASVERLQSHPESRGLGVGKRLMETLVEHARSLGLEQLHLVLRGGQQLEAFYLRQGWTEIGRHPAALRLADDDRDEVSMLLDISPGSPHSSS